MLSDRAKQIDVSPTMKVLADADRLRRAGVDVVDFGAGEPDFPTPAHVKAAAHAALDADFTKYTPNAGISELKRAVCRSYAEMYGVNYTEGEAILSAGGKQALYNTALALFGAGDEVITHSPGWPTIREQIKMADARPVLIRTHPEDGFRLHAQAFIDAITPRTRGIIINSPCNPTGALISEDDLRLVVEHVRGRNIWIVLDLCYERLIYDPVSHNLPGILAAEMRDRAVLTGSASKTYSMTGWRCGWVVGPAEVIAACAAIQSHSTSNVNSITQKAVVAALEGPQDCVREMLDEYRTRRDAIHGWLTGGGRIRCEKPGGAFYLFVDISDLLSPDGVRTSSEFAQGLLEHVHVAVTPGEAFDAPGFLRISYATSLDRLREGAGRILDYAGRIAPAASPALAAGSAVRPVPDAQV
jgi:aspartate aminotransferase